jgi:small subunit ribosomal protein S16
MSLRIRLRRVGRKKQPSYRIVVTNSLAPRDGAYVDDVGFYNPRTQPAELRLDLGKVETWLGRGATLSGTAASLVRKARKGGDARVGYTAAPAAPSAAPVESEAEPAEAAPAAAEAAAPAPAKRARAAKAEAKAEPEAEVAVEAQAEPEAEVAVEASAAEPAAQAEAEAEAASPGADDTAADAEEPSRE